MKYIGVLFTSPIAIIGLIMWAFLLWNSQTGGSNISMKAVKIVFFKP